MKIASMGKKAHKDSLPVMQKDFSPMMKCIFLNLGEFELKSDSEMMEIHLVKHVEEVYQFLTEMDSEDSCVLIGVSRNLMKNYLALSSLLFSEKTTRIPLILVNHPSHKILPSKAFLFGEKPEPIHSIDPVTVKKLIENKKRNVRHFLRIPVEFVAFAVPSGDDDQLPVVCKNISWGGTYFETKRHLKFRQFKMVLRSRLHKIEIPSRIVRLIKIETSPKRFGYGIKFLMPLPLTLIQYMFMKHMKDLSKQKTRK